MKKLNPIFYVLAFIIIIGSLASCSQNKKEEHAESEVQEHDEEMESEEHEHGNESGEDHHGGHDDATATAGEGNTWMPGGNGTDVIKSDFHFITGNAENINPEVVQTDGRDVLQLTADGTPAAFVFHNSYGNVGLIATIRRIDFTGTIQVIHHAQDNSNYEYVSINGNAMKLGRVVEGTEKVFDESDFAVGSGWIPLKVTAAGTHFKGYIGSKSLTHGHGDKMEDGYVGIMLNGTGKIEIKSIETTVLEDK